MHGQTKAIGRGDISSNCIWRILRISVCISATQSAIALSTVSAQVFLPVSQSLTPASQYMMIRYTWGPTSQSLFERSLVSVFLLASSLLALFRVVMAAELMWNDCK